MRWVTNKFPKRTTRSRECMLGKIEFFLIGRLGVFRRNAKEEWRNQLAVQSKKLTCSRTCLRSAERNHLLKNSRNTEKTEDEESAFLEKELARLVVETDKVRKPAGFPKKKNLRDTEKTVEEESAFLQKDVARLVMETDKGKFTLTKDKFSELSADTVHNLGLIRRRWQVPFLSMFIQNLFVAPQKVTFCFYNNN